MIKLILSKSENLDKNFFGVISSLKGNIISVLSSKPYSIVKEKTNKICKSKQCLFLDTVADSNYKDVVYLPAENLTSISIAINQAQQSFKGKATIVFDTITNLAIKNDSSILIKFFSFILSRSHEWSADLIFILPNEGVDENLMSLIKQSSDKIEKK